MDTKAKCKTFFVDHFSKEIPVYFVEKLSEVIEVPSDVKDNWLAAPLTLIENGEKKSMYGFRRPLCNETIEEFKLLHAFRFSDYLIKITSFYVDEESIVCCTDCIPWEMGEMDARNFEKLEPILKRLREALIYFANHNLLITLSLHDIYLDGENSVRLFPFFGSMHFCNRETAVLPCKGDPAFLSPQRLMGESITLLKELSWELGNIALMYSTGQSVNSIVQELIDIIDNKDYNRLQDFNRRMTIVTKKLINEFGLARFVIAHTQLLAKRRHKLSLSYPIRHTACIPICHCHQRFYSIEFAKIVYQAVMKYLRNELSPY